MTLEDTVVCLHNAQRHALWRKNNNELKHSWREIGLSYFFLCCCGGKREWQWGTPYFFAPRRSGREPFSCVQDEISSVLSELLVDEGILPSVLMFSFKAGRVARATCNLRRDTLYAAASRRVDLPANNRE